MEAGQPGLAYRTSIVIGVAYGGRPAVASTRQIEVIVTGVHTESQAQKMQDAIRRLSGVRQVGQDECNEGELYLDVEADSLTADRLAAQLEKALPGISVTETSKMAMRAEWNPG
jgi:hypothetical protein